MIDFNPFGKELAHVERADLDLLINEKVAEGWFVEYKSIFVSPKDIGHSIASFANTDGGWYIIGVKANRDTNEAEEISGFDIAAEQKPKDKISNIVRDHVHPKPYFDSKLIEIGNGKGVLIVRIDRGSETPYVTTDGRIYHRVGEQSSPVVMADRYLLEKLFDRSREANERIEKFCENPFVMSKSQAEQNPCLLEVYLFLKPYGAKRFEGFLKEEFLNDLQAAFRKEVPLSKDADKFPGVSIKFDNIYTSYNSYILRHFIEPQTCTNVTLTVELFGDGSAKFFIPLENINQGRLVRHDIYGNSGCIGEFNQILDGFISSFDLLNIIDAYHLFCVFYVLFNQYVDFINSKKIVGQLNVRLRIKDCWKVLLYLNDESYVQYIKDHGLPICQKDSIEVPEFFNGRAISVGRDRKSAVQLVASLLQYLGYPMSHQIKSFPDGFSQYLFLLSKWSSERRE